MPTISVIVPVYKTPKIKMMKCIHSILNQTYQDFELLLIDDGNPSDYFSSIVSVMNISEDSRIRIISRENQGVSAARNMGIDLSQGKYISFIDSDDYIEHTFLEELLQGIERSDLAICGVGGTWQNVHNLWYDRRVFFSKPTFFNGLQYINYPVNKLFKRSIIQDNHIRFDRNVKLGEDALFVAQYFTYCNSIKLIGKPLYYYVLSGESATRQFQRSYWDWEECVIDTQWELFHQYPLTNSEEEAMLAWLFRKFNGAINYYSENIQDNSELIPIITRITDNPYFSKLSCLPCNTKHLSRRENIHLLLWKKAGKKGVIWGLKLHHLRNRGR